MTGVVWFAKNELRWRWRAVVGLALLVALAGGVVLAATAGARRTSDVTDRFLAVTAARDASVQIDDEDPGPVLDAIEQLDVVEGSGRLRFFPILPDPEVIKTEIDLMLQGSPDGRWGVDIDRPLVVRGRVPDPSDPEEVMLNELAARQAGLDVGDRFSASTFTPEQLASVWSGGEFTGFDGPTVDLEVVGIGRQGTDLQGAEVTAGLAALGTPALLEELEGRAGAGDGLLAVDLAPGATVADLREGVRSVVGDETEWEVGSAADDFASSTEDATDVLARGLWIFASVAALATAVAVGGTISRQCAQGRSVLPVLEALGCRRNERAAAIAAVPVLGLVLGAAGAVVVAAVLSPRFPVSVARQVEPEPGFRLDPLVLGVGFAILVGLGAAWVWAAARSVPDPGHRAASRRTRLAAGLPLAGAIGLSHAFEPGGGERAVPVRAALVAATAGVLGIVVAATLVHSLDRFIDDPHRYGWAWTAEPDLFTDDPEAALTDLVEHDGLSMVALRHNARVELDGVVLPGVAFEEQKGLVEPTIRSGRAPASASEIAIGQHTADQLGVGLGDTVRASRSAGGTVPLEVVGFSVVPPVDSPDPAAGAVVTLETLEQVRQSDGYRSLLLDYVDGADQKAIERSLTEDLPVGFSVYSRPRLPGTVANLHRAMPIVAALAGFSATLGVVAVGHVLVVGCRRRRRSFSTFRALGMKGRQIRTIVTVHALATVGFALAVAVPLGVAGGRMVWELLIADQGLVDAPSVPVLLLLSLVPATLLLGGLLSWWPGRMAGRAPAQSLRAE